MHSTSPESILPILALLIVAGCTALPAGPHRYGAEGYLREVNRQLDAVQADMPAIIETAHAAAKLYVHGDSLCADYGIASEGERAFMAEGAGRSGLIMQHWMYAQGRDWKGIVLYCLREGKLNEDFARIRELAAAGSKVFVFGSHELLDAARAAAIPCEGVVTVPAAPNDGFCRQPDGTWVVPTYQAAGIAVLIPWLGEFVAACTREGKMPVMWQSIRTPTGRARQERWQQTKFHDPNLTPPPVKPGVLAGAWIAQARKRLAMLRSRQMANIQLAAERAANARRTGHKTCVISVGHATACLFGVPHDPRYFEHVTGAWNAMARNPARVKDPLVLGPGDFVVGVGYDSIFSDYHDFTGFVRKAEASAAWLCATYRPEHTQALPGEILIDTQWEYGDADVSLPGYDIDILPNSGLLTTTAYMMINAQIHELLSLQRDAGTSTRSKQ
ncbi:MAG TPA: hypothetical protein VM223_03710 [Planctomycetota bacterium]|nr:hypothetical protein [Planctomycetota bacterium]